MKINKTQRGFKIAKFKDTYGNECSIQKSSSAKEECIWIGIDKPELTVFEDENMGKYIISKLPKNWDVNSRMHLNMEQIKSLLPLLQKFVETGDI